MASCDRLCIEPHVGHVQLLSWSRFASGVCSIFGSLSIARHFLFAAGLHSAGSRPCSILSSINSAPAPTRVRYQLFSAESMGSPELTSGTLSLPMWNLGRPVQLVHFANLCLVSRRGSSATIRIPFATSDGLEPDRCLCRLQEREEAHDGASAPDSKSDNDAPRAPRKIDPEG